MELDYNEIHHSRKIRGTEQAESTGDKRFREILKRCIVQAQRAIKRLRQNKEYNWRPQRRTPLVKELSQAESMSPRSIQHHHFKDEIETLSKLDGNDKQFQDRKNARERNGLVKLSSNLHRLDPFVDTQGMLSVVGRLKSATSSYSIKHPIIIP